MEENVKVSVIMPIYNTEKYLVQSLESVINQTLKEIEIVCVNDGSTDSSLEILSKYQEQEKRIKIINKKNTGYGDSMNEGIREAKGEYVGIVEPDDFVEITMFEKLYNVAKRKNINIVKSNYIEFDETSEKFIQICPEAKFYNKKLSKNDSRIFKAVMNTWTGIYKKSFLIENQIWHNTSPGASFQDTGFWFQTVALANSVWFVNKAFYHHRMDNPNSSINNTKKVYCVCDEFKFIENKLKEKNVFNELQQIFLLEKFNCYIYSFFRIAQESRKKFLQDIEKEFENVNIDFAKEYFAENKLKEFKKFIENPNGFFEEYKSKTYQNYLDKTLALEGKNKLSRIITRIKRYGLKNNLIMIVKRRKNVNKNTRDSVSKRKCM